MQNSRWHSQNKSLNFGWWISLAANVPFDTKDDGSNMPFCFSSLDGDRYLVTVDAAIELADTILQMVTEKRDREEMKKRIEDGK